MKKGIKESKVQRMRNLVTGNYTANTKLISGYTPEIIERKEGDIWKEKGTEISSTGTRKYDNIGISGRVGTKSFGKTISTRKAKAIGMGGTAAAAGYFGLESNKRGKR